MKVDLHTHTTASDGKLTPEQLVISAVRLGINILGISDHDTVAGIPMALETAKAYPSITVVPAVEINCDVSGGELHVLGYFIDYHSRRLNSELERLRTSRCERGAKMVAKLQALGMNIKWERVQEIAGTGSIGRPHVAQALLEAGYVSSFRDAFDRYIGRNGPAYVEREKITPAGAVKLVLEAGGLPVLAHPADIPELNKFIEQLKVAGLVGIEAYYNGYKPEVIHDLVSLASSHRLIITGGSDYHGSGNEAGGELGQPEIPEKCARDLFALAGKILN
ncbi:MAG: PHP domain-containing protein [Dehalococcoidia bacterium]|nr:PHP domain-containing protein [Dehalococcoidia bacterium]